MHEPFRRQLFSNALAILLAMMLVSPSPARAQSGAGDAGAKPPEVDQELQSALLVENAVLAKSETDGVSEPAPADIDRITQVYTQIIAHHPKSAEALNSYGEFLWRIKNPGNAMAQWTAAETLDPKNAAVANHLGGCQLALGDARKATEYYERAANLNPKNAVYQFDAGNSCFLFRRQMSGGTDTEQTVMARSLDHFQQAVKIEPFNIEYARGYAETFYLIDKPDWKEALNAWGHYLQISDQKDFAYVNLARVNLKMGNKAEAKANLAKIASASFNPLKAHMMQEIEAN
jgi:tetratricopeptide (TPR) repeat protein